MTNAMLIFVMFAQVSTAAKLVSHARLRCRSIKHNCSAFYLHQERGS